jgi:hypothetical protein
MAKEPLFDLACLIWYILQAMKRKYSERVFLARPARGPQFVDRRLAAALALLAAMALAFPSCARRPEPPASAEARAEAEQPRPAEGNAAAPPPPKPGAKPQARPAGGQPLVKPRVVRPILAASLRAFGLGSPNAARLPEDYSLGSLQDYRSPVEAEKEALALAKRFMEGFAEGKLDPSLLVPGSRDALALLLAPGVPTKAGSVPAVDAGEAEGGFPYRLGKLALLSERLFEGSPAGSAAYAASASLRVRLPSGPGEERLEGSLALGKIEGSWYVEALALDPPPPGGKAGGPASSLAFDPARRSSP